MKCNYEPKGKDETLTNMVDRGKIGVIMALLVKE